MSKKTEIAVVQEPTPLALFATALEKGIDPDKLSKLLDLHERVEKMRAEKEFATALANFQAKCGRVFKRRQTKEKEGSTFGTFKFASFDDIMSVAGPILAEEGISVAFDTDQNLEKGILTVTCRVRVGSHVEDRKFACPVASTLRVSDAQKFGSALSYAKRYCLCAALNIVTTDQEDDDGQGTYEYISPEQIAELNELLMQIPDDRVNKFKTVYLREGEALDSMLASAFPEAVRNLKTVVANQKGKA